MAVAPLTVCVTGASGFIASHIVAQCLEKGWQVRGTVRNASDAIKTSHLMALPGASERLSLFSAELLKDGSFDEAIYSCGGVFHVASPLPVGKARDKPDPENEIVRPAVEGTLNVLRSCKKANIKNIVLTSSMSSIAPVPEPAVKTEEHWSDPDGQRKRGSWYGAGKTLAERAAWGFVEQEMKDARLATICPTMTLGPMLQSSPNMTMLSCRNWFKDGRPGGQCPNDSMSFIDVRECAAQHVTAMENTEIKGRFMSLAESFHWNDLDVMMAEIYPKMPKSKPCDGEPCEPTRCDLTRQSQLGVKLTSVPQILRQVCEELKSKGLLE